MKNSAEERMHQGGQTESYESGVRQWLEKNKVRAKTEAQQKEIADKIAKDLNKTQEDRNRIYNFLSGYFNTPWMYDEEGGGGYYDRRKVKYKDGGKYKKGGLIVNQYKGKTPEQIWSLWKKEQRHHFLYDHLDEFLRKDYDEREFDNLTDSYYKDLPEDIRQSLKGHIMMGSYKEGGKMKNGGKPGEMNPWLVVLNKKYSFTELFSSTTFKKGGMIEGNEIILNVPVKKGTKNSKDYYGNSKLGKTYKNLTFIIDYPLEKSVEVHIQEAKTVGDIIDPISKKYKEIYKDKETAESYGVWGHGIDELVFEEIKIVENGIGELSIGS